MEDTTQQIKSIDKDTVHRITSGQVVVDLATAVKELVENSLDSGASNIEVKFKDQGLTSIEVIDDGTGINKLDYPSIARKHHTSKITQLSDLTSVQTFGFRGEALASLCAMCEKVTITTATAEEAPMGTVLVFARSGELESSSKKAARQRGTSVLVEKLFAPLPVRRRELERMIKRDYARALQLMQAYALVPSVGGSWFADSDSKRAPRGIRLTVSNQTGKGARQNQVQSAPLAQPNTTVDPIQRLRSNVSLVWGPKTLDQLVPLELEFTVAPDKSVLRKIGKKLGPSDEVTVRIRGLISKFTHMSGRLTGERQFYYLNGRPFEPKQIQKAFNEVYKTFNSTQIPMVVADVQLPGDTFDINVSPDKRMIMLHNEPGLISALKASIEETFASARSTYEVNDPKLAKPVIGSVQSRLTPVVTPRVTKKARVSTPEPEPEPEAEAEVDGVASEDAGIAEPARPLFRPASPSPSPVRPRPGAESPAPTPGPSSRSTPASTPRLRASSPSSRQPSSSGVFTSSPGPITSSLAPSVQEESIPSSAYTSPAKGVRTVISTAGASWNRRGTESPAKSAAPGVESPPKLNDGSPVKAKANTGSAARSALRERLAGMAHKGSQVVVEEIVDSEEDELDDDDAEEVDAPGPVEAMDVDKDEEPPTPIAAPAPAPAPPAEVEPEPEIEKEKAALRPKKKPRQRHPSPTPDESRPAEFIKASKRRGARCVVDMGRLTRLYRARAHLRRSSSTEESPADDEAESTGLDTDATQAEQKLSRTIQKQDFLTMDILGQFNLGFVIVRLRKEVEGGVVDDLFIVDQHAADEKYNFERLQRTTKIQSQRLIRPRLLELSIVDELTAIDNMEVLKKNGFIVQVDEVVLEGERPKLRLAAQPMSKGTMFDMKDLEEILHQMKEGNPSETIRCSKARAMFAMRACRSSIMIGTALKHRHMVNMVRNLAGMDLPWNCPHGRPTMRHLCNLRAYTGRKSTQVDWKAFDA
ncbi:hypothetical protein BDV93DRAFT_527349 [Ceratobasidium sp. AG-I]|nr:hypothetical protein BDV93DRAFT_527349 [Ceratobasidium sp. AG-I]